jgi:hypothetical protein
MPEQVGNAIKKRSAVMLALAQRVLQNFNLGFLDRTLDVLLSEEMESRGRD